MGFRDGVGCSSKGVGVKALIRVRFRLRAPVEISDSVGLQAPENWVADIMLRVRVG